MKYIKLFEELEYKPKSIFYTKEEGEETVVYTFDHGDYTVNCEFNKIADNVWRRDFYTMEEGFIGVNAGPTFAINNFAYITKITQDFINEYQPEMVEINHTDKKRFDLNWKFMQNMNIKGYQITNDDIKTIIKKNI